MAELIKEGKIKHYGLSNESPWGVAQLNVVAYAKRLPKSVTVQNGYSLCLEALRAIL